jgi:hypothetical protein
MGRRRMGFRIVLPLQLKASFLGVDWSTGFLSEKKYGEKSEMRKKSKYFFML